MFQAEAFWVVYPFWDERKMLVLIKWVGTLVFPGVQAVSSGSYRIRVVWITMNYLSKNQSHKYAKVKFFQVDVLLDMTIYRQHSYLTVKSLVSCNKSQQPTQWFSVHVWIFFEITHLQSSVMPQVDKTFRSGLCFSSVTPLVPQEG